MTYRADTDRLAGSAQQQLGNLYAALQAGKITVTEFKAAAVQVMLVMMTAARQVADAAVAKLLTAETGSPVMPVGVIAVDAAARLGKALDTVLANPNGDMAVRRFANAATLEAAQLGWGNALRQQPGVTGWTRETRPGACEICQRLTGTVLSLSTPIYHHPGCHCVQKPVLSSQQFS